MSEVYNTAGVKPGSIYRIALENFVTYKQVELFPGNSLNMIIGPNGTGKSTFVCAIILGLCGKTSVIGRANKISEFVRSSCEEATIEIELFRGRGERNVIITRTFNLQCVSSWHIDRKPARDKQVQELIESMNIKVDNLCQLLPQDRVHDFAKMDPQQLLRSTLEAVSGQDSVCELDGLIKYRTEQRDMSKKRQNNAQRLEEEVRLNERLKGIIDAMEQRKEIEHQIEICEKKLLWIEYQELKEKFVEYTNDKKEATKIVNKHKKEMEPLERVIEEAKVGIGKLEKRKLAGNRQIHTYQDKIKDCIESVRTHEYSIKDLETTLKEKIERWKNRERELVEARSKLEKLEMDKRRLVEKVGDESHVKMQLAELNKPLSNTNAAIDKLKRQKLQVEYDLENNVVPQIRMFQNRVRGLQDMDAKRLEALRAHSGDAHRATLWLREHRGMFAHAVYEPMMLEINFTDPKFARYMESRVPARDLAAFTFESKDDMNRFMLVVRQELGLKRVNALHSAGGRFQPRAADIQELSYLGFYTYLSDTITAPDPILRYLCKNYNIHRIPIGNDHTYNNSAKVPANITFFFTENHRFSVRVSAYSGNKSVSTVEIRPAHLLANTADVERISSYTAQLSKFEEEAESHKAKIKDFEQKINIFDKQLNDFNMKRKQITDGVEKVRTLSAQIKLQNRKVNDIEREPIFNLEEERVKCRKKQMDLVKKQGKLQQEMHNFVKELHKESLSTDLWKAILDHKRNGIRQRESQLREKRDELRSVEQTLETIEAQLTRARINAKQKLTEAKASCGNMLPQDPNFPFANEFEAIPAEGEALRAHCDELGLRARRLQAGGEQVIEEYEQREKLIASLRSDVNNSSSKNQQIEERMNLLKQKWLPPTRRLLEEINRRFSDMLARLGCAGEVRLHAGGSEDDFDKYGINIMVKFRSSEQLQQLSRYTQSGGERAIATAVYLCALQHCDHAPFRLVDEINQGMDPINERKMFQLLVNVTTQMENAQYFLLTPKLLPKLEYSPKIKVHTIMNGRHIMNYRKWKGIQLNKQLRGT